MMIISRDRDYVSLLSVLKGRKIHIWTCNTCARLCNNVGGIGSAEDLAKRLSSDGVEISGISSVSASCLMSSVMKGIGGISEDSEILVLACNIAASCVSEASGRPVFNPIRTLGTGYLDSDGSPKMLDGNAPDSMMSPY